MKSLTEYLTFTVPERMAFVNITPQVEEAVRKSGVAGGPRAVQRHAHHGVASSSTTTSRGCTHDYEKWLEQLAPFDASPAATTTTTAPARTTPTPT